MNNDEIEQIKKDIQEIKERNTFSVPFFKKIWVKNKN